MTRDEALKIFGIEDGAKEKIDVEKLLNVRKFPLILIV